MQECAQARVTRFPPRRRRRGFMGPPDEHGSMEVGCSVIPDRRRRGYATEAARAMWGLGAHQPTVTVAEADCASGNLASIRTLERIGFVRTGEATRQIRWGCTRGELIQGSSLH